MESLRVTWAYNDYVAELERREARTEVRWNRKITLTSVAIATVAALASMVAALAALAR